MDMLIVGALLIIVFNIKAFSERLSIANKEQREEVTYEQLKADIRAELKKEWEK